jgi:hypothetical protein
MAEMLEYELLMSLNEGGLLTLASAELVLSLEPNLEWMISMKENLQHNNPTPQELP